MLQPKDTHRLKVRVEKKIFTANGNEKKASIAIIMSDNIVFKTKSITKDKERYEIMIKWSIQEGDITLINIYAPNVGAHKYINQILTDTK